MDELAHIRSLYKKTLPTLSAMGDSTRQQLILLMIEETPKSVQELSEAIGLSRPAISHHLKILKSTQLVTETRQGMKRYYQPSIGHHLDELKQLINEIERLESLKKG